ncbi:Tetraspanin-6 [Portunus trituberculatus]|uniref:Tetraspanin-6 n=1 Tax=Portunus trituberculatus TaxID=210409 RepID=A0A5B7GC30_PORTR|nr:Tetraspanin-6 [Portunus trituberculatus]
MYRRVDTPPILPDTPLCHPYWTTCWWRFWFSISGLLLIIVGGIAQGFFSAYLNFFGEQYETPAIGIIILGGIILVISFFGCCGAKRENVFMLKVFAGLMVLTLILEFAAAITVAVMRPNIEELVKNNMNSSMDKYGEPHNVVTEAWDNMQMNGLGFMLVLPHLHIYTYPIFL